MTAFSDMGYEVTGTYDRSGADSGWDELAKIQLSPELDPASDSRSDTHVDPLSSETLIYDGFEDETDGPHEPPESESGPIIPPLDSRELPQEDASPSDVYGGVGDTPPGDGSGGGPGDNDGDNGGDEPPDEPGETDGGDPDDTSGDNNDNQDRISGPEAGDKDTDNEVMPDEPTARVAVLYGGSLLARSAETIEPAKLNDLYEATRPTTRRNHIAARAHEASRQLDLALSEGSGGMETRLEKLEGARDSYLSTLYKISQDEDGRPVYSPRPDRGGRDPRIFNEHYFQARLAMDYWPVNKARITGQPLSEEDRTKIFLDTATTLETVLSLSRDHIENLPPTDPELIAQWGSPKGAGTHSVGTLTEALAFAAASRHPIDDTTFMLLPTSELRRLDGGPDATVPLLDGREKDIDCKSNRGKGADVVRVGYLAHVALIPPVESSRRPDSDTVRRSTITMAELLVQESQGERLSRAEREALNRLQHGICDTIYGKAKRIGIPDIRAVVRFR